MPPKPWIATKRFLLGSVEENSFSISWRIFVLPTNSGFWWYGTLNTPCRFPCCAEKLEAIAVRGQSYIKLSRCSKRKANNRPWPWMHPQLGCFILSDLLRNVKGHVSQDSGICFFFIKSRQLFKAKADVMCTYICDPRRRSCLNFWWLICNCQEQIWLDDSHGPDQTGIGPFHDG